MAVKTMQTELGVKVDRNSRQTTFYSQIVSYGTLYFDDRYFAGAPSMIRKITPLLAVGALLLAWQPSAVADDTGFASIHALGRSGRNLCMVDHEHSGSGSGKTKSRAKRAAIGNWAGFTAWEYGTDWASFRRARVKSVKCARATGGWSCDVTARPCKRLRRRAKK